MPPTAATATTVNGPEKLVECGVSRPASPHRRTDARIAACCSAAGTNQTMQKPARPHREKTSAVSRMHAVRRSGGSAQMTAAVRFERSGRGRSGWRFAARTRLNRGKAAEVVTIGRSMIHRDMRYASLEGGSGRGEDEKACGGADGGGGWWSPAMWRCWRICDVPQLHFNDSPKLRVMSGLVARPK